MVVGTAQYLSPEQAQGLELTSASDVYSLGVVAYECLTGARPFDGASQVAIALAHINRPPPPLPAHIPPAVRLLVERALAKDPADRFPDGGAFADAVRRVAAGGTLTPVAGPVTRPTQIVAGTGLANSRTQVIPATTGGTAVAAAGALGPGTGPGRPMPPLAAPSDQDDDWDAVPEDEQGPSRRWAWVATALVLLLLLGGGTWFLLAGDGKGGTGGDAGATTSSSAASPTGITLDPAVFIGHPADEVEATLQKAGLVVTRAGASSDVLATSGQALLAGDVAGLNPSGKFAAPGTPVTLYVAQRDYTPGGGSATSDQPKPTTSAPPATTSSRSMPTTTAPDTSTVETATSTPATSTSVPVAPGTSAEAPPTTDPVDPGTAAPGGAG
jgi:serine/threonine-protein kinase